MKMRKHPIHNVFVTKDGRVFKNGRWATLTKRSDGYVVVSVGGRSAPVLRVHALVLETYVGSCPEGMNCRHLDGDKENNKLRNLKWGTLEEQIEDQKRHGTFSPPPIHTGEKNRGCKGPEFRARLLAAVEFYISKKVTSRHAALQFGVSKTHLLRIVAKSRQEGVRGS